MVGIENNRVVALFSNTMNSCEAENIKLDDSKQIVNDNYDSIEYRKKMCIRDSCYSSWY